MADFYEENEKSVGQIQIADEVIAIIAGTAASEVEGVETVPKLSDGSFGGIFGKKNNPSKGIKVSVEDGTAVIDADLAVLYGVRITEAAREVQEKIKNAVLGGNSTLAKDFDFIDLDNTPLIRKQELAEEHLISPVMCEGKGKSVMISKDRTMSIMLMEEDHIRLQIIKDGFALDEAYSLASKVDDVIEENITYAFDNDFGYLTACPTNTGTGMRASVMMHLPALTMTENINRVISSAGSLGIEVRGLYGEGTKAYGNLYQISNRITLGLSESQVIEKLTNVVNQIIDMETKARNMLKEKNYDVIADRLFRSYGTLKYARSVSSSEAKSLLSDVMLGQSLGIIPKESKIAPLECMVLSEPALVCDGKELSPNERDKKRAELIRNNI